MGEEKGGPDWGAGKISVREKKILFELRPGSGGFLGAEWGVK